MSTIAYSLYFSCRLREVSEKISRHGYTSPPAFQQLRNVGIQQVVLGPNHVALLLEDGRVCRLPYSLHSERLDLNKTEPKLSAKEESSKAARSAGGGSRGIRIADTPLILIRTEDEASVGYV